MLWPGRLPHQPGPLLGPSTVMRLKTRSSAGEQRLRSRSHVAAGRLGRRLVSCEVWHPQQRPERGAAPHQRCWRQRLGGHRHWPGASEGQDLHLRCRALAWLSSLSGRGRGGQLPAARHGADLPGGGAQGGAESEPRRRHQVGSVLCEPHTPRMAGWRRSASM